MRGILLDRDGVINRERADYVKSWEEFKLLPGALPALRQLAALDIPIALITNQSAIGRGLVTAQGVAEIHANLIDMVERAGGRIDAVFVCPHTPDDGCDCRKPRPGLLKQAAAKLGLDLHQTVFVGDAVTDYGAAIAAGCQPLLVGSGRQGALLAQFCADRPGLQLFPDLPAVAAHLCEAQREIR